MGNIRKYIPPFAAVGAMIGLILDSRTAIQGATDALQMCIRTAIPSLFPFFVLSGLLVPYASRARIPWLGRLLHVPTGWESIFLLGCIGGYPVGAQCVAQGYVSGKLQENQAERMLGFCTNCGPAFLFGIVGGAFSDLWAPLSILLIGILSALLVGALWPKAPEYEQTSPNIPKITLPQAVQQATRSMASVCAWIILGKTLLTFAQKWILWMLPLDLAILLTGLLELTNGCLSLAGCSGEDLRFLIACGICSFGGLCVAMQAAAICVRVNLTAKSYIPQKALQAVIAVLLAYVYQKLPLPIPLRLGLIAGICGLILILRKMTVEIPAGLVYNRANKGGM